MINNLLLSNQSERDVDDYIKNPSHAVLIIGQYGMGKLTLSNNIAATILDIPVDKLINYQFLRTINPVGQSISIEEIRNLKQFLSLKTTGKGSLRRIVIIESVNVMTNEAQNAILKILEEPPEDTIFLLTASNLVNVNETLISRARQLRITRPTLNQSLGYFSKLGFNDALIRSNYIISNGAVGILSDLLANKDDSELVGYVNEAKSIVRLDNFARVKAIDELSKDKDNLSLKIFALKRVFHAVLIQSVEKNNYKLMSRSLRSLKELTTADDAIKRGVNTRLIVTNLLVNL